MASALKCDLCGALYETVNGRGYLLVKREVCNSNFDVQDLCPSCYRRLQNFVKDIKEEKR